METSSRKLPPLAVSPVVSTSSHGHGTCREGIVPSGLRRTQRWRTGPGELGRLHLVRSVRIDYSKLRELCLHTTHVDDGNDVDAVGSREENHRKFMSSYRSLLQQIPSDRNTPSSSPAHTYTKRRHTCTFPTKESHDVASYTLAIHRRNPRAQAVVDVNTRLTAMLRIVRKLPIQRDTSEVKQLSHHLSHFPSLLPDMATPPVLVGVAARCVLETIPKEGFSLPGRGGVYLILQGCVKKKIKEETTQQITSSLLYRGDHFGVMEENFITKSSYPMYVTSEACTLMRITVFDYQRVLQNCQAAERKARLVLINSCRMLHGISPAIISALASDVRWETVPSNTTLLCEGDVIKRIGFVQSGHCQATMSVPRTRTTRVVVGDLGPGACVGEGLLRGTEEQPYQVTTTTRVKIGWVSATIVRMNEVQKLIPAGRDLDLSIPVPSKDLLRHKYASELIEQHWGKIKELMNLLHGNKFSPWEDFFVNPFGSALTNYNDIVKEVRSAHGSFSK